MTSKTPSPKLARVLIVDDEIDNLSTFKRVFRREFVLDTASSGEVAVELLNVQEFDVALVDYAMPGMSGIEFLRIALKVQPNMARILLTAHADLREVRESYDREYLTAGIIPKPWDPEVIRRWIGNSRKMAEARQAIASMKCAMRRG